MPMATVAPVELGRKPYPCWPARRSGQVRAVVERVEVDEPSGDVRVFIADLNPSPAEAVPAIAVNS